MGGAVTAQEGKLIRKATVTECRFCGIETRERVLAGDSRRRTVVVPSKGALVPGWILVVPVDHVLSLAELPDERRGPFALATQEADLHLRERLGAVVQFEHGPAAEGRSAGCGVDHAHLHLVPLDVDLRAVAASTGLLPDDASWRPAVWPWAARSRPHSDYLFVRDTDGSGWILEASTVPSQLFRRALARLQGHDRWDWKDAATPDESPTTRARWADGAAHRRAVSA